MRKWRRRYGIVVYLTFEEVSQLEALAQGKPYSKYIREVLKNVYNKKLQDEKSFERGGEVVDLMG
jgi:hypothetical protein